MEWKWDIADDIKKVERSRKVKIDTIDQDHLCGKFVGSAGEIYQTTLDECTCFDFVKTNSFCKHMLRLAMELGLVNTNGRTEEQQHAVDLSNAKNTLALCYGHYHLFGESILSDEEYDALKQKLSDKILSSSPLDMKPESNGSSYSDTDAFILELTKRQIPFVDKRSNGGRLWIKTGIADRFLSSVKIGEKKLSIAGCSRAFKGNAGWYLRED